MNDIHYVTEADSNIETSMESFTYAKSNISFAIEWILSVNHEAKL